MKSLDVAALVINRCIDIDKPVSNLKLPKVIYFLHLWHLIHLNKKLITDEEFIAKDFGPVLNNVYNEYALYAGNPIDSKIKCDYTKFIDNDEMNNYIYGYLDKLANEDSLDLLKTAKKEDNPYSITIKKYGYGNIISDDLMNQYAENKRKQLNINLN